VLGVSGYLQAKINKNIRRWLDVEARLIQVGVGCRWPTASCLVTTPCHVTGRRLGRRLQRDAGQHLRIGIGSPASSSSVATLQHSRGKKRAVPERS
jgi:hypothetical protein